MYTHDRFKRLCLKLGVPMPFRPPINCSRLLDQLDEAALIKRRGRKASLLTVGRRLDRLDGIFFPPPPPPYFWLGAEAEQIGHSRI